MDKKIIEYKVALGGGPYNINDQVNELIKDGFQPFGPVSITVDEESVYYAQAMVRYEG